MSQIEITVRVPNAKRPIKMTSDDIYALIARTRIGERRMTVGDLAQRIGKRRESLSRFLNGRLELPELRKVLAEELARMLAELPGNYIRAFQKAA